MARNFTPTPIEARPSYRRYGWYAVVFALFVVLLIRQASNLHFNAGLLRHTSWPFVALAVAMTLLSHFTAAYKYQQLAFHRLNYWRTLLVQLAALLTSRLLPAGLGGVGVNYLYLRGQRHNAAQAAVVVSVNNLLGVAGNGLLVVLFILVGHISWHHLFSQIDLNSYWLIVFLLMALLASVSMLVNRRIKSAVRLALRNLLRYRHHPLRLLIAIICSMIIAMCYASALFLSAKALNVSLGALAAVLVMTIGVAAGSATPTPGGIGGTEAGLIAALSATGMKFSSALSVTILYRLISFWLSLVIGSVALVSGRRVLAARN